MGLPIDVVQDKAAGTLLADHLTSFIMSGAAKLLGKAPKRVLSRAALSGSFLGASPEATIQEMDSRGHDDSVEIIAGPGQQGSERNTRSGDRRVFRP